MATNNKGRGKFFIVSTKAKRGGNCLHSWFAWVKYAKLIFFSFYFVSESIIVMSIILCGYQHAISQLSTSFRSLNFQQTKNTLVVVTKERKLKHCSNNIYHIYFKLLVEALSTTYLWINESDWLIVQCFVH